VAAPTNVLLGATPSAFAGHGVAFHVRVTRVGPASGRVSGGTVTFFDDGVPLATVPAKNGRAVYATRVLARGAHQLTVSFSGSATDLGSASAPSALTVI